MGMYHLSLQYGQKETPKEFMVDITESHSGTKTKSKSSDTFKYEEFKNLY